MNLQERMVAVYLRQAKLPPEEKEKLRLFLGLLLTTFDEEEDWEKSDPEQSRAEQSRAEQSRAEQSRAEQSRAPAPETLPATTFSQDRAAGTVEAQLPTETAGAVNASSAKAPGEDEKEKTADPLAEPLLKALEKQGLSLEEAAAEKHIGVRASVLQKVLDGEPIRKDSREKISRWVQSVGIAVTEGI